ncbi:PepSY-associated TM helix domain-containing protein [uncultured Odoribacter sp.]|uniref:PepSY-associated TM helix domain-containing protein n=1 Tax=uncultured Odoribacter sp. TaxID=876416 RepID=UPI002621DF52|nr:PepSY-associated TM helix domain-containing protein [uncultured Odoribacter sp.]
MYRIPQIRKWCRFIHRDLSYFFAGIIVIYAVSGMLLNHKRDFNAEYAVSRQEFVLNQELFQAGKDISREDALAFLKRVGEEEERYTKHYFPKEDQLKIFIKGGSSLVVDLKNGEVVYEQLRKRPVVSAFNRLHYNPGRWWTVFSDIFALSLLIITLTGLILVKGNKGLWGRGGIELLLGILFPLAFLLFF